MKYNYSVLKDHNGYTLFKFTDELKLLEYVFEDMLTFKEPIFKEAINKVISGQSEYEEIGGNMCSLEIRKNYTTIYSEYISDGMLDELQVETSGLFSMINNWLEENGL